jgi:hypothetical protein
MDAKLEITPQLIWAALKQECCVHPETAQRCVMVNEKDIVAAFKRVLKQ